MAVKRLIIHPAALEEMKSAVAWYMERSETAALNFVAELERGIDQILEAPSRWPHGGQSTRKYVLRRYPFAVVYREKETAVEILAVAHGYRRPSYWKGRL